MPTEFHLRCEPGRLRKHFDLSHSVETTWISSQAFVAGSLVATIEWNSLGKPILQMARFGYKMREGVALMTNFRSESVSLATPSRAFLEGRCIVPVDVFSEQVAGPDGPRMISYGRHDDRILGLAAMLRPAAVGVSVVILTVPANETVRSVNGRMPGLVGEEDYDGWLDDTTPASVAFSLMRQDRSGLLVERDF